MFNRECSPKLESFFDSLKLDLEGLSPSEMLIALAAACIGIHEEGGDNMGSVIELFQGTEGVPEGQAWCLDFVQSLIAYVESVKGISSSVYNTAGVCDLWNHTSADDRLSKPEPGDIILWRFGQSIHGHCGIVLRDNDDHYETIEGNTSNSEEIDRNGDGVFYKVRHKNSSPQFSLLGFIRPF